MTQITGITFNPSNSATPGMPTSTAPFNPNKSTSSPGMGQGLDSGSNSLNIGSYRPSFGGNEGSEQGIAGGQMSVT